MRQSQQVKNAALSGIDQVTVRLVFGHRAEQHLIPIGTMTRGGKREGSGRPRSDSKKIRIATSLAVDVVDYLNSVTDRPKAQVIEEALREHKDRNTLK